jgi:hypothetical protein
VKFYLAIGPGRISRVSAAPAEKREFTNCLIMQNLIFSPEQLSQKKELLLTLKMQMRTWVRRALDK